MKLKLQYFGHLVRRADSLEKTPTLGEIAGRRRRGNRGWDGWMASPTRWTWVWASSRRWWRTGKPRVLQSMGSQRVGRDFSSAQSLSHDHSLQPQGLQHTGLPCPSPSPGACSDSCPLSQWGHPTILSSVVPFSSCLQSFPASGSFPMSYLFTSSSQRTGASATASVLPKDIQVWFPLGLTGWISL